MTPLTTDEDRMQPTQASLLRTGLDAYRWEAQATNFKLKFRGYSPLEVDAFVDRQLELYEKLEAQLKEVREYEYWLKEVVREQVITKAQKEAEEIKLASQKSGELVLQQARQDAQSLREEANTYLRTAKQEKDNVQLQIRQEQEQSRKTARQFLTQTEEECSKQLRDTQWKISQERDAFQREKQDFLAQWSQEQAALNQKLQDLRNETALYRTQVTVSLEKALTFLRQDQHVYDPPTKILDIEPNTVAMSKSPPYISTGCTTYKLDAKN